MKVTEHALKRLDLIMSNPYAHKEVRFLHNYLLPGTYTIQWDQGIRVKDIWLFAERCEKFGVRFLGLETHIESPYPLHIYCYEDCELQYNTKWIPDAIRKLEIESVTQNIVPTISVPTEIIDRYLF